MLPCPKKIKGETKVFHTFDLFQTLNKKRCEEAFKHPVNDSPLNMSWPWYMWAICITGEAGEFANLTKKICRGDFFLEEKREELLKELADVIIYADLAISSLGANTDEVLSKKFEEVNKRLGWEG